MTPNIPSLAGELLIGLAATIFLSPMAARAWRHRRQAF